MTCWAAEAVDKPKWPSINDSNMYNSRKAQTSRRHTRNPSNTTKSQACFKSKSSNTPLLEKMRPALRRTCCKNENIHARQSQEETRNFGVWLEGIERVGKPEKLERRKRHGRSCLLKRNQPSSTASKHLPCSKRLAHASTGFRGRGPFEDDEEACCKVHGWSTHDVHATCLAAIPTCQGANDAERISS